MLRTCKTTACPSPTTPSTPSPAPAGRTPRACGLPPNGSAGHTRFARGGRRVGSTHEPEGGNVTPVVTNDWSTALMTSVAGALALFLAAVPRVIGFVLIVLIGWLIASALAAV